MRAPLDVNVLSQAGYPNAQALAVLVGMLQKSTQAPQQTFWPDDTSALDADAFEHRHMRGAEARHLVVL